ncbi:MAG: hypothetical protein J1F41_11530, partial [Lachnospiraceae bacterium]|nr:hypothetical protein [Lachnospiraceae bacterium]
MKKAAWKMKRMLSVVLAVAMVVTMLPNSLGGGITVSAAETSDIAPDTEFENTEGEILDSEEITESEDEYEETEGETGSDEEEPVEQETEEPAQPEEEETTDPADPEEGLDAEDETPVEEEADVTAQSVPAQTADSDPVVVTGGLWGLLKILKDSNNAELQRAVWASSDDETV